MSQIKISFDALESVASASRDAASQLNGYADAIPGVVNNPLNSLVMGASSNTSTAASLASQKASSLRNKANRYSNFSNKVTQFASTAKEADERVEKHLKALESKRSEGLSFWDKIGHFLHNCLNGVLGTGPFASAVRTLNNVRGTIHEWKKKAIKDAWEWLRHGEGRYILNALASVVGTIAAFVTMVGALASILAFPIGTILGIAAIISFAVSLADTVVTVKEASKALKMHSTEPGIARYYGETSSLSDYYKKESTDRNKQNIAQAINFVGAAAGLVTMVGNFTKTTEAGKTVFKLKPSVLKENFLKSFGVTKVKEGTGATAKMVTKFNPGFIFGLGGSGESPKCFVDKAKKIIDPVDNILSFTKDVTTFDGKGSTLKNLTSGLSTIGKIVPEIKVLGYGKKIYKVGKYFAQ